VGGNIAAVENKVEKVECDIAEVKAEIALYKAFPSLNTFDAAADLDEFAAFARGNRARQRNALEVHLAQALPQRADALRELQGTLKELQGTLKELQHKENALRDEKTRLEASNTAAQGLPMFRFQASFVVVGSAGTLFRSMLHRRLVKRGFYLRGKCDRDEGTGTVVIDIFVDPRDSGGVLEVLRNVVDNLAACGGLGGGPGAAERVKEKLRDHCIESMPSDTRVWEYTALDTSPKRGAFKRPVGFTFKTADPILFPRSPKKKHKSSSDGSQNAHILFATGYRDQLMSILTDDLGLAKDAATRELNAVLALTEKLAYRDHQDYDNFHYFFAWKVVANAAQSDSQFALLLSPRFVGNVETDVESLFVEPNLNNSDRDTWIKALVLRKNLTLMVKAEYAPELLRREWNELPGQSGCWELTDPEPATP
jgi:hypothetical protein